eukprot:m.220239 g.220239  ORF g.220239 m.220239 type:complete len:360 (+) comp15595_c0_seq2:93-1172(+)
MHTLAHRQSIAPLPRLSLTGAARPGKLMGGQSGATVTPQSQERWGFSAGSDMAGNVTTDVARTSEQNTEGKGNCFSSIMSTCAGQKNDVNDKKFWENWDKAGGDADRYVREAMPNYAVTASLLITMTFPYSIESPESIRNYSPHVAQTFTAVMTLATLLCVFIVITTLTVYQQYCCTIDDKTALNFAAHYGWLIPMLQSMLLVLVSLFVVGMGLAIISQDYGASEDQDQLFWIVLAVVGLLIMLGSFWMSLTIPIWNQNSNYLEGMKERFENTDKELKPLDELIKEAAPENCDQILDVLTSKGCKDADHLVHFMHSFVHTDKDMRLGAYAKTLEPLGIGLFDALRIVECVGIDKLSYSD